LLQVMLSFTPWPLYSREKDLVVFVQEAGLDALEKTHCFTSQVHTFLYFSKL
jgi:hypothetical protein